MLGAQRRLSTTPGDASDLALKAGVHFGHCIAVTMNDRLDYFGTTVMTKGVTIPVGNSKTIEVDLFSDADTGGPWTVAADDLLSIDLPRSELPVPPCTEVLGPNERTSIRATIISFNAEIAAAVADTEQQRGVTIAQVDTFTLFDRLHQQH